MKKKQLNTTKTSINRLLIANRGEIACRIIKTAKKMGIHTIAVYSEADRDALHTSLADESIFIGSSPASESYLNIETIIQSALDARADAIHPGYGFLSENADFADRATRAGLLFTGPPSTAIRSMGNKTVAKRLMQSAGVPLIPGFSPEETDKKQFISAAKAMGYPLLIKASAGGGGKGMRVVCHEEALSHAFDSAQREAISAFGNGHLLLERYIRKPRHIEVQIFFDQSGNSVYLFDRDCSLQRRYQKVIEEAPAPKLSMELNQAMGEMAIKAGKAVNYVGAGTVEFLLDNSEQFYFMEMNTRLQVEHPVTEMITGIDLVEWQLRIAAGETLPVTQTELTRTGHAIEVRLYAEDPQRDFTPVSGHISYLQWPSIDESHLRIETGVSSGDHISNWYDPMIAKLVTRGSDRKEAVKTMETALINTHVAGIATNRDFLIKLLKSKQFLKEEMDTFTLEDNLETLLATDKTALNFALMATALWEINSSKAGSLNKGWRLNGADTCQTSWSYNGQIYHILIENTGKIWQASINGEQQALTNWHATLPQYLAAAEKESVNRLTLQVHSLPPMDFTIITSGNNVTVIGATSSFFLTMPIFEASADREDILCAPMNGIITCVSVHPGDTVIKDDTLITIEAMKMEINIKAPKNGIIDTVSYAAGDPVEEKAVLISYCEDEP